MSLRRLPAVALATVGVGFLAVLLLDPPSAGQGGPGVAYAGFVLLTVGGSGLAAVAVGAHALWTDRVRLPATVLAGYLSVLAAYAVVRRGLLLGLSPAEFALATVVLVLLAVYGTYRLAAPVARSRPAADG